MVKCVRQQHLSNHSGIKATVVSVSASGKHNFSKQPMSEISLIKEIGIEGDAHAGKKIQHRSRAAKDPDQPNLRQIHLIQEELFSDLKMAGFDIGPGDIGENITTKGIDLLNLPKGTILKIGSSALIEITGLRNPCIQTDSFREGLMSALVEKEPNGYIRRKAGVMGIVLEGGSIKPGDLIRIDLPAEPRNKLEPV